METAVAESRISHLVTANGQSSSFKTRRQHIEPLFGFVDFGRIRIDFEKPWQTRVRKDGIDSRTGGNTDIDLLAENLSKKGIIEPLHVLYEGEVNPELWDKKATLALEVPS